jgi:tyrosinase-like protein/polyphenol oxidase family protein
MNEVTRRTAIKIVGGTVIASFLPETEAQQTAPQIRPRIPLHEFVQDAALLAALRRGVSEMKKRKPSDPLSWFYQAAMHGVTVEAIQIAAQADSNIIAVDQKKYWNQCPHFGQASANFLPWHRAYTYYFERIVRAHTGDPAFSLPYWDYLPSDRRKFPKDFGIQHIDGIQDQAHENPLFHPERDFYFTRYEHWSGGDLPYSQLADGAVDWSKARDSAVFFGQTEREGLGGAVDDEDSSTRGLLESYPHDPIHRVVGGIIPRPNLPDGTPQDAVTGAMASPPTAGFDPIFCVHHTNIDRLWAEWSCMPGKSWGVFPPQAWFDDDPWVFFDVEQKPNGLVPKEVRQPRKAYFDYRALGIRFKNEHLTKTPLVLPDPIPTPSLMAAKEAERSKIIAAVKKPTLAAALGERVMAEVGLPKDATAAIESTVKSLKDNQRILVRLKNVNLGLIRATGFDVHVTSTPSAKLTRADASFVGSISLFVHSAHQHDETHGAKKSAGIDETFDATKALKAIKAEDLSKLNVVLVPYQLTVTIDQQKQLLDSTPIQFDGFEFLVRE